jgi:hypothetical protein
MFRHSPSNPQDCRPPKDDALASVSRSIEPDENHGHQPTEAQDDAGGLHGIGTYSRALGTIPVQRSPIFPGGVAGGVKRAASTADVDQ